jgi:3-oxoacyl-[acyl-carrier protein] reductase
MMAVAREAERHGVKAATAVCDLAVASEITAATARVLATSETIHILANCAGIAHYGAFHLSTEEAWRRTIAVNLLAPMQIVHELLPTLLAAEEAHVLNVCSFMGLVPVKKLPVYQASKFGLVGFTLALRNDYHRETFGVTALCPGFVRTPMLQNVTDPEAHRPRPVLPDFMSTTPEAVAAKAIAAIRHNRGLMVVTPTARLTWCATWLSPALVDWINREGWRRRRKVSLPKPPEPEI